MTMIFCCSLFASSFAIPSVRSLPYIPELDWIHSNIFLVLLVLFRACSSLEGFLFAIALSTDRASERNTGISVLSNSMSGCVCSSAYYCLYICFKVWTVCACWYSPKLLISIGVLDITIFFSIFCCVCGWPICVYCNSIFLGLLTKFIFGKFRLSW